MGLPGDHLARISHRAVQRQGPAGRRTPLYFINYLTNGFFILLNFSLPLLQFFNGFFIFFNVTFDSMRTFDANNAVLVVIGFFLSHGVSSVNSTGKSRGYDQHILKFYIQNFYIGLIRQFDSDIKKKEDMPTYAKDNYVLLQVRISGLYFNCQSFRWILSD